MLVTTNSLAIPGQKAKMHELDRRHSEFLAGAALDSCEQDTGYGISSHKGWATVRWNTGSEIGQLVGVTRMAFSNHDPGRNDDDTRPNSRTHRSDRRRRGISMHVFASTRWPKAIELDASRPRRRKNHGAANSPPRSHRPAVKDYRCSWVFPMRDWRLGWRRRGRRRGETTHALDAASNVRMRSLLDRG